MNIERSELAKAIQRLLYCQGCDKCPLRRACDVYEENSLLGCETICILLKNESE